MTKQREHTDHHLIQTFEQIGQTLLTTLNLDIVLDELVKQIVQFGIFRSLMIALCPPNEQQIKVVRQFSALNTPEITEEIFKKNIKKVPIYYDWNSGNITSETARTQQTQITEGWDDRFEIDSPENKVLSEDHKNTFKNKVCYFIPILYEQKTIAVIATSSSSKEKNQVLNTIKNMQPFLSLVSIALHHAQIYESITPQVERLEEQVQDRTRSLTNQAHRQTLLFDISRTVQKMRTPQDLSTVLKICYEGLIKIGCNAQAITVHYLVNKKNKHFRSYRLTPSGITVDPKEVHQGAFDVWQSDQMKYRKNVIQNPEGLNNDYHITSAKAYGFNVASLITLPFPQGVLMLLSKHPHAFSQQDLLLGKQISEILSVGITRLEDLEKLETRTRELEYQNHRQKLLIEIGQKIQKMNTPNDMWHIAQTCYDGLQKTCPDLKAITIHHLINIEKKHFSTYRITPSGRNPWRIRTQRKSFATWQAGHIRHRQDLTQDLEGLDNNFIEDSARIYGFHVLSMLSIPFKQGVLILTSPKPKAFQDTHLILAKEIVEMLSVGIRRLEDLQQLETHAQHLKIQNTELESFAYTVSHDLKSPLVTIQGFLGLLKKDMQNNDPESFDKDLAHIRKATTSMTQLLNDLLELSRIGRFVNPSEDISITDLTQHVVHLLSGHISKRNVTIQIEPHMPLAFGDRARISQVLQNLIENAIKFMGNQPNPCIEIGTRQSLEETTFFVQDNGIGIDPRYHNKVFNLFDRLDQNIEGTGIGLALVKRIIELHNGRIWVESKGPNTGSTFLFTLPISPNI